MLFNSYTFVSLFLPILLILAWALQRSGRQRFLVPLLLTASLVFYAWWSAPFLGLLLASIVVNFALGTRILQSSDRASWALWLGVLFNLVLLGYFKYANFFIQQLNDGLGLGLENPPILLPLAISFFTFQQIAFLVDCRRGSAVRGGIVAYALFVSFFPQLIAGPIVRSAEVMPQIQDLAARLRDWHRHLAPALTLFVLGLSKKVLLADRFALYSSPVFSAADGGAAVSSAEAWIATLAYTLQLYFDFSGYSDMAIALAWLFGIRLPVNFLSPYRATNIADFWRRWHITLSRFLREYLYIPLGGNRRGRGRQLANLMVTMLLGGLWHGAGWNFVLWGGLHGALLAIHRAWQVTRRQWHWGAPRRSVAGRWLAWGITLLCVMSAWVLFRAETLSGAGAMLGAMYGFDGFSVPRDYSAMVPGLAKSLGVLGVEATGEQVLWAVSKTEMFLTLGAGLAIVLLFPNTARLFALVIPRSAGRFEQVLLWRPGAPWLIVTAVLFYACLVSMTQVSEFLYFRF